MTSTERRNGHGCLLRCAPRTSDVPHRCRKRVSAGRYVEVVLEYHAFVRPIDLTKGSDSYDFHHVHTCRRRVTAIERKTYLVWSAVAIAFAGKRECTVGKGDAHQEESRIRRCTSERGNIPNKRDWTRRCNQSDLTVELTHIRRWTASGWQYLRIGLGATPPRCRPAACNTECSSSEKQT